MNNFQKILKTKIIKYKILYKKFKIQRIIINYNNKKWKPK